MVVEEFRIKRETTDPERDTLRNSPPGGRNTQPEAERKSADRSSSDSSAGGAGPATGKTPTEAREATLFKAAGENGMDSWKTWIWILIRALITYLVPPSLLDGGGKESTEAEESEDVVEEAEKASEVMDGEAAAEESRRREMLEKEAEKSLNVSLETFMEGLNAMIERSWEEFGETVKEDLRRMGRETTELIAEIGAEANLSQKHNGEGLENNTKLEDCGKNDGKRMDLGASDEQGDNGGKPSEGIEKSQQLEEEALEGFLDNDIRKLERALRAAEMRREEKLKMLVESCKWENIWPLEYSEEEAWESASEEEGWDSSRVLSEEEANLERTSLGVNDGVLPREEIEGMEQLSEVNDGVLLKGKSGDVLPGGVNDLQDGSFDTNLEANTTMLGTSSTQHREEEGFSQRAKFESLWWQACILFGKVLAALLPEEEREERQDLTTRRRLATFAGVVLVTVIFAKMGLDREGVG